MKKMFFIALAAIAIVGMMCSCQTETAQESVVSQEISDIFGKITDEVSQEDSEKKIDDMLEENKFIGVAVAVKDGEILYNKSFNPSDDGQQFDSNTVFRIASDTKQFTAAAIMLLQEQGKLSVNDTLDKYFSEYSHAKEMTIHQLLCMRSGIGNYTNFNLTEATDNAEENKALIMEKIFEKDLVFSPNEQYMYSNSNYFLLANIIEQVSGVTYEEYLTENIFKPLNMTSTGFFDSYSVEGAVIAKSVVKSTETDIFNQPAISFGAGDMMSNAEDLQKWLKVFEGGSILSDDSIKAMTTGYSAEDDEEQYGYGLMIGSDGVYHGGNLPNYTSVIYTSPSRKCSVIMLSNEATNTLHSLMSRIRYELF